MLVCEVVHPGEVDAQTRGEWLGLLSHTDFRSSLMHPDFARVVGQVRPDTRVALYREGGQLQAVLPFQARPGGLARPLAAPFSDLQAFICTPGCALSGAEALAMAGLRAYRFEALIDPRCRFKGVTGHDHVHAIVPGPDIDAFLEGLRAANPKRFKNHRRLARQMADEKGQVDFCGNDHDPRAFDQLMDWKHAQFERTGKHNVLKPIWAGKLMTSLFNGGVGDATGLMATLKCDGRLVAGLFGVRTQERFNPWVAAYDPAYSAWSPGQTILHEFVAAMPSLGLKRCDLGAGHDHYKKYYANVSIPVSAGLTTAPGSARRQSGLRNVVWSLAEGLPVAALAGRAASAHRRADQIAASDLDFSGRFAGALRAVLPPRSAPGGRAA